MVFVTNNKAPEILQPGKQTLHFPSTPIASELSAILGRGPFAAATVRRNHFNATLFEKLLIKTVAIIGFITNKLIWRIAGKTTVDGCLDKLYFMGRSAFHMSGDRKTTSVCNCQDLGAFAALCLADSKTPFFAGAKQPSMNASRISIWPRSYRSSTSSFAMRWKMPSRTHCWNRRWHVWYGGYRCGRSFQGAPVRKIHKMALRIWRESRGRRPLGSFFGVNVTITGSIRLHCSFVSSILILLHNQDLMSRFILR
jgi:hypothetical protein